MDNFTQIDGQTDRQSDEYIEYSVTDVIVRIFCSLQIPKKLVRFLMLDTRLLTSRYTFKTYICKFLDAAMCRF